ncbi:antibiotic biosynthesis monooxygenase [Burkholderia ubonensis]|uniref:putative quinol monooxygenase n=1 Tax=Burkholderia ubonensis TaxID=101571 RepID=UPI0008FDBA42|nr:putative quinol monooxygenase [Burkholderia ubonensis]OJA41633.1 antibiotic biosynthesis monooxygenase [Burkholderia ubonensis]OJB30716.1 antibiotic biosynthesis monooxygenase [Burkholderia ubonensis]
MPVYVIASLIPKPEHAQTVETELRGLVAATRAEPGNLRYDLFRQADGSPGFDLFEVYEDVAALEAHRASPHYIAYRAKAGEWLAQPPVVKVLAALDAVQS